MFAWDPAVYSRFEDFRFRPALDLLSQIHHGDPRIVYDLGTGRGDVARLMADRWPGADVFGIDTSAEMLEAARATPSRVLWQEQDVRDWDPPEPPDVIYSNAMLHWVPAHDDLLLSLLRSLRPGGVLAVQMPLSWHDPSHRLMRETLAAGRDGQPIGPSELRSRVGRQPVAPPEHYYRLLRRVPSDVNVWQTTYFHVLQGEDGVFDWVRGSALRPILEALEPADCDVFIDNYREKLRDAYPAASDGTTVYRFPRLFIVAKVHLATTNLDLPM